MRGLLVAAFLPLSAFAQLQLFQYDGTTEKAVGQVYDAGSAAVGESSETRFRVHNTGQASVNLTSLSVAGPSFRLSSQPTLPYVLARAALVEFRVVFFPQAEGPFSATLQVNTISVVLRGTASAIAVLSSGQTSLSSGAIIDFGKAVTGTTLTQSLTLTNPSSASISISTITVTGSDFKGPLGVSAPLLLAAGQSVPFTIVFSTSSATSSTGTLTIDQRSFHLTATSTLPPIQLYQFDGTTEKPLGQLFDVGTIAPGDSLETRFRVRNPGAAAVSVTNLSVNGAGFRLSSQPSLPYIIAPGSLVDFKVMFSPSDFGSYSASLQVNTLSVSLHGTAVAGAVVMLGATTLTAGATVDFGQTEPGTSVSLTLMLSNPSSMQVAVSSLAVTGADFTGPAGASAPLTLSPGQSVPFAIKFAPSTARSSQGVLSIDQRLFNLAGVGVNPPIPKASIQFDSSAGISSRQARVSIQLASSSRVAGTGTLTLEFKSAIPGATDDAAIQFLSGPKRNATVTIGVGDAIAKFGSSVDLAFQTGTTAGTIMFTLKLPNDTQQATFAIPAAPVFFDNTAATRRVSDLDVSLIGFDNTHSASQLTFTFYDKTGKVLQPGAIRVDETADFRRYFDASSVGGSFQLRATFPVAGDATQVAGVDVEMANTAGVTKTQRITF